MKKLKLAAISGILIGALALMPSVAVMAATPAEQAQAGVDQIGGADAGDEESLMVLIGKGINTLLFLIGAVAVFMIVWGGFHYVISRGDSAELTTAKNTILYAVVGIVVAILAYAVVNFVTDAFQPDEATASSDPAFDDPQPTP